MEFPVRDMKVLQLLCRNGVMSNAQVKFLYGNTSKYYLRRLERMSKNGYIVRKSGYVSITQKGVQLIGGEFKATRVRKWNKSQRADLIDLVFKLPEWEIKFGTEIKRERGLNRGALISALIKKREIEYAIYMLATETPRAVSIGRLWREINELPAKSFINRAIVFCYSPKGMSAMVSKTTKPLVKELLLLPYPYGLEIFKKYQTDYLKNIIMQRFPGAAPSGRLFADFLWQGKYVAILIGNDFIKRYYLKEYFEGLGQRLEKKEVIIVCIKDQYRVFSENFPHAKFAVLQDEMEAFLYR